jgi:hypothetical protein
MLSYDGLVNVGSAVRNEMFWKGRKGDSGDLSLRRNFSARLGTRLKRGSSGPFPDFTFHIPSYWTLF